MPNRIEKSFSIGSKRVTMIYELSFYSERLYRLDFQDFLAYHTKQEKISSPDELDWKFYPNAEKLGYIPYETFIGIMTTILTKVFFQLLKSDTSIMASDQNEFKVYFIVFRVSNREWYFVEDPKEELQGAKFANLLNDIEMESVEHSDFLVAGVYLIQSVVWPWHFRKRIDYSYLSRYLMHELEHHKQTMEDFYRYEDEVQKRLGARFQEKVPKIMNYRITYIFLTFRQLLIEGIADFVTIGNRPKIDFHMDYIYDLRKNMEAITTMQGKNKLINFWVENLSYDIFAGGTYYCGKIMCFTIELAIAKRMSKSPLIYLPDGREFPLEHLDKIMSKEKLFYVGNPDNYVFREAYNEIRKTRYNYRKFMTMYESACKELGIRKRNMVVWYGLFDDLKKKASKFYERYSRLRRADAYKKIKAAMRG